MEFDGYARFVLSLVFVIGLILLAAWAARRFGYGVVSPRLGGRKTRRLALIESIQLDPRRRLVLVKRDDVEHLLLLGGASDFVVENVVPSSTFAETLMPLSPGASPGNVNANVSAEEAA